MYLLDGLDYGMSEDGRQVNKGLKVCDEISMYNYYNRIIMK